MNILYISDINHVGKFTPDFSFGFRPFMSWVPALDATHCSYYRLNELDVNSQFDLAIVGCLNNTLLQDVNLKELILNKLRTISKKIAFQQESNHRSFIQDAGLNRKYAFTLIDYFNFISECDIILAHNDIDVEYFNNLFNKPCYVHPQLLIPIDLKQQADFNKPDSFILSSFTLDKDKGGSLDGYLLVKEFNLPINVFENSKVDLPLLNCIPYDPNYVTYNEKLSKFKIGVNVPHLPIGGSFPLQCAMMKVPCVGWSNGDPQRICFPELSSEYPNFNKLRTTIKKLLNDKNYYIEMAENGYKNFINNFTFDLYIEKMVRIFNEVL